MPTPVQKPRRKAEQRAESLEQILDAAEELFSKHGLHGVTIKDIADQVGVHKSLVHYYFTDKQDVFDKVMARRAPITSGRRMDALDAYEKAANGRPTVEGALRAFLDTDLDTYSTGGEGWRHFGALGAQLNNTPVWGAEVMDRLFDPVVLRLIGLLKQAMPGCPDEDIFWGYHFVTGALTLSLARTGRIDHLSGGLCRSDDFEAIKARMATFMAHGFIGMCESRVTDRARPPAS
ncbi:TetR/AcrR family transcriptional regulator [Brevundimonas sp.]|uniref:TetR/AcrR family transcriptional regulator n=1 Tax=Brevundimonas sp. TaxID=1871086 RepID=UPI002ABCCF32|nr:TetR/AcrR family transcriptional regulator [Brevundimonas sp.]MDZ4364898.1 TetR/AcrR family transcriptional regulator [Brevundimonas sp.]